ncbi:hypothetical protein Shyhy02_11800 [Streptomyces hygroscopicus subsp. hygroscopicus]|nr:hypothetical protein Shyhy02_11800 [Streptomyces hygroscopicus subsp. hygroscopicus]
MRYHPNGDVLLHVMDGIRDECVFRRKMRWNAVTDARGKRPPGRGHGKAHGTREPGKVHRDPWAQGSPGVRWAGQGSPGTRSPGKVHPGAVAGKAHRDAFAGTRSPGRVRRDAFAGKGSAGARGGHTPKACDRGEKNHPASA